ncbi:MAG: hypothetical protein IPM06_20100 [Rhizobiales bacterium]|nr:hypothetical protein [Hyphomicrobiales bacterium]
MNQVAFFSAIRPAFGGKLSDPQVVGMGALLTAGDGLPLHHMANVLAQVRRETGGYMTPIKETVMPYHKDKSPSDATVIARLDKAWKAGQLPHVKEPYWRDGMFGRGMLQITHRRNYQVVGRAIGFDLAGKPELLLDPAISAVAAVVGMTLGLFTGKKLSDFAFPGALSNTPDHNPRRIVNGRDGSDKEVAGFHRQFATALEAAGWAAKSKPQADHVNETAKPLTPTSVDVNAAPQTDSKLGFWAAVLAVLAAIFGKGK